MIIETEITRKDMRNLRREFGQGYRALENALEHVGLMSVKIGDGESPRTIQNRIYTPVFFGLSQAFPPVERGEIVVDAEIVDITSRALSGLHERIAKENDVLRSDRDNFRDVKERVCEYAQTARTIVHETKGSVEWQGELDRTVGRRRRIFAGVAAVSLVGINSLLYGSADLYHRMVSGSRCPLWWHMNSGSYPELRDGYMSVMAALHVAATVGAVGALAVIGARKITRAAAKRDYIEEMQREHLETTVNLLSERYGFSKKV